MKMNNCLTMKKHLHYDLWFHDGSELMSLLGNNIVRRETIHEWPNSCVQRVTLENSKKYIYKYQSGGTIESLFYERASSLVLPKARTLWRDNWYSCILLEHIDTPVFGRPDLKEPELLKISDGLLEIIREIQGDFPVLLDISTYSKWTDTADETISLLRKLVMEGRRYGSGIADISFLEKISLSHALKSIYRSETGLIHGDLNGGNIFPQNDGYKLIDWQSCKLAPTELDRVSFLYRQGIDPSRHVEVGAVCMLYFISIWWLVKCQTTLIPEGNYDENITYFITRIKKVSG